MKQEIVQEATKSSPAVMVTGWAWTQGLSLTDLVAMATLVYIGLQAGYLVWKWIKEVKRGRR